MGNTISRKRRSGSDTRASVRYGEQGLLEFELPPEALVAACDAPYGRPIVDLPAAVAQALGDPLDYPPLRRAVVPGDKVVLAVEPGIPRVETIVAAVAADLVAVGIEPPDITVLWAEGDAAAESASSLGHLTPAVHQPANRGQLRYLAATDKGEEIYLNRAVCDADLVVPIGCFRAAEAVGYYGVHGATFPTFSSAKTQARFRGLEAADNSSQGHGRAVAEANEVGWLLGTQFTVQVVPGAGDSVLEVLAGHSERVQARGAELFEAVWTWRAPQRASLVVAAIEGGDRQQTWENFGRALAAAGEVVAEDGAIAICSDLAAAPAQAMQRLAGADDRWAALRRIRKEPPSDILPATRLAQALDRGRVYLLSRLDECLVEDLGMAAVASGDEIARLAGRHASCILLANADRVAVAVADGA
jgi:nickel-dependent lactate racemase